MLVCVPWGLFYLSFDGLTDNSDSMINQEGGARKEALIRFMDHITEIYSMANESGILAMHFMNDSGLKRKWNGKSRKCLDRHILDALVRIGTELERKILDLYVSDYHNLSKPLLVLTVTAGAVCFSPEISKAI